MQDLAQSSLCVSANFKRWAYIGIVLGGVMLPLMIVQSAVHSISEMR